MKIFLWVVKKKKTFVKYIKAFITILFLNEFWSIEVFTFYFHCNFSILMITVLGDIIGFFFYSNIYRNNWVIIFFHHCEYLTLSMYKQSDLI